MALAEAPERIVILDDDENDAEGLAIQLEDFGVESEIVKPRSPYLQDTVEVMAQAGDAAICDHVLRQRMAVDFDGAEVVAALNQRNMPAVLFTSFPADIGVSIRQHRPHIPVLLGRDEAKDGNQLLAGLATCAAELSGGRASIRTTHRVPVAVERVRRVGDTLVADGFVGGWRHEEGVPFPLALLSAPWDAADAADIEGRVFFARVNIGALRVEDLFFELFEEEPAPAELSEDLFDPPHER